MMKNHGLPDLAMWMQWSPMLIVGIGFLLCRTFHDVVKFEYLGMKMLAPTLVSQSVNRIQHETNGTQISQEDRDNIELPSFLRWFSLAAPPCGIIAYFLVVLHLRNIVKQGAKIKTSEHDYARRHGENPQTTERIYRSTKRQNMIMLVILLPVVFVAMSMRAQIRIWEVMTGTAWIPYLPTGRLNNVLAHWDEIKTAEMTTQDLDIALANFFQLQAVGAFGVLVISYLKDAPPKYRSVLSGAGLLGLWCYVVIASIVFFADFYRALLAAAEAADVHHGVGRTPQFVRRFLMMDHVTSEDVEEKFLGPIQPMNLIFTLLCVANMLVYERMDEIKAHLGEATLKFNATKLLLILTHVQPIVISHITHVPLLEQHLFHSWHPSASCQALIHCSLLIYESLIVVLVNAFCWGGLCNADVDHRYYGYYPHLAELEGQGDAKEPLLAGEEVECLTSEGNWVGVMVTPTSIVQNRTLNLRSLRLKKTSGTKTRGCCVCEFNDDTDVSEDEEGSMTEAGKRKQHAAIHAAE